MAKMLGRYETPGCCPGTRQGRYRGRRRHAPECIGALRGTRKWKRKEAWRLLKEILDDL